MEMESAESDHASDCIKETAVEDLFGSGSSPYACDFEGELPMIPISARVGDEYQVEIPVTNPADSQSANDSNPFLVGLPIPIKWVNEMNDIAAEELEFPTTDQVNKIEAENLDKPDNLVIGEESGAANLRTVFPKEKDSNQIPQRRSCYFSKQRSKGCFPVPDSSYKEIWSDAEVDSFLLGLYIFRKNFNQLKRFMEHKNVGEIQSFYYQRFYGSDEYHRWSDCHKNRNKRCIIGEKLFIGWRQQELISRMIPHLQEEAQKTLAEVKSFQKDSSLEEYVFSLKATVGLHVLVKAVGIGKGKEDLTGFPTEPGKNNQENPVDRVPKMPKGKDFASLSFTEIVNVLTGGVRLSKTRSNEIFWEAVWPRLLANGWHSEQPKNLGYLRSEDYLVFLMPGIKKYSKRKLTKGDHYYDSVSDVLKKVQSEPKLIQLGAEEDPAGCCNEGRWVPEVTSDQEDVSDHQRTRYLKPRVVTSNSDHMKNSNHTKFTVVDTSLPRGGKACGIVELRYPPVECKTNLKQTDFSSDGEEESSDSEISEYKNDIAEGAGVPLKSKSNKAKHCKGNSGALRKFTVVDTSLVCGGKLSIVRELRCSPAVDKRVPKVKRVICENSAISSETLLLKKKPMATDIVLDSEANNFSVNCREDTPGSAEKMESHQDQKISMTDAKQPNMSRLSTFRRRAKSSHSNTKGPPMKRRRLTSCVKAETSSNENCLQGLQSEQVGLHGTLNNLESGELIVALVGPQQKESSSMPQEESCSNTSQAQAPSNLNAPQDLVDSKDGDTCIEVCRETNTESSGIPSGGSELVDDSSRTSKTYPRKSTRVRPPTTKALEALANGFLAIKPRQKRKRENSSPHPSRKPRKVQNRDRATSSHADVVGEIVTPKEEMEVNEACNVNQGAVNKPLDQNGEKLLTSY